MPMMAACLVVSMRVPLSTSPAHAFLPFRPRLVRRGAHRPSIELAVPAPNTPPALVVGLRGHVLGLSEVVDSQLGFKAGMGRLPEDGLQKPPLDHPHPRGPVFGGGDDTRSVGTEGGAPHPT